MIINPNIVPDYRIWMNYHAAADAAVFSNLYIF